VIADFTATTFCDPSVVREVALAHGQAADMGTELRLANPSPAVQRVMALTGLDQLMPVYRSVAAARFAPCAPQDAPGEHDVT
jgi:anti-sigma B factor antagonist